jgi:hypothetical protein
MPGQVDAAPLQGDIFRRPLLSCSRANIFFNRIESNRLVIDWSTTACASRNGPSAKCAAHPAFGGTGNARRRRYGAGIGKNRRGLLAIVIVCALYLWLESARRSTA